MTTPDPWETIMSDLPLEVLRGIHKKLTDTAPEIETELCWHSVHWQTIIAKGIHAKTVLHIKDDGIKVSYYENATNNNLFLPLAESCDVFFSFNDDKIITKCICTFIMMANAANGIY
jgi:hypothetical protein